MEGVCEMRKERACMTWEREVEKGFFKNTVAMEGVGEVKKGT